MFVRYYETGGTACESRRPAGVEGWLPIASLMNLKVLLSTGRVPRVHPAGMFLLIAFLGIVVAAAQKLLRLAVPGGNGFGMALAARQTDVRPQFRLPRWLDMPLRGLKYILLGLFLYAVAPCRCPPSTRFWKALTAWWTT